MGSCWCPTIDQLRREGRSTDQAILAGCTLRLWPVMMTMMTTLLGLLLLAVAQSIGAEVQRPVATVVIGGLLKTLHAGKPNVSAWKLRLSEQESRDVLTYVWLLGERRVRLPAQQDVFRCG